RRSGAPSASPSWRTSQPPPPRLCAAASARRLRGDMELWRLVALLALAPGALAAQGKPPRWTARGTIARGHPGRDAPTRRDVLLSGGGTNLQALLEALRDSPVARIARVVASRVDAGALARARRAGRGVSTVLLAHPDHPGEVVTAIGDARLVVLAGYLKRIPPAAVAQLRWRLINIHPALLPAFGGPGMYGRRVHEAVLASGVALTGASVHYVDEEYDRGPI